MSNQNYIIEMLELKDNNINFYENWLLFTVKLISYSYYIVKSKKIAFGFRSFRRFKARIMICKNLLHMKRINAI